MIDPLEEVVMDTVNPDEMRKKVQCTVHININPSSEHGWGVIVIVICVSFHLSVCLSDPVCFYDDRLSFFTLKVTETACTYLHNMRP